MLVEPGITSDDPDVHGPLAEVEVDIQRAHLQYNDLPLDWERYAAEFRADLPPQIAELAEAESRREARRASGASARRWRR